MKFAIFDPRPIPAAYTANATVLNVEQVLGIEVTVPQLASQCVLGNIDPQHTDGRTDRAAIEEAVHWPIPPSNTVLATVRADLDSIGAMAVLSVRAEGGELDSASLARVAQVARADSFARGTWPGKSPLPTTEHPWADDLGSASDVRSLAAIAAAVADFKIPVEERVAFMRRWLLVGEEPVHYRERVEKERGEMIRALKEGDIKVSSSEVDDRIVIVTSTHRAAMSVGYTRAPVVVALNPSFRVEGGEVHKKFTIATYEPRWCDINGALTELSAREPGWGGSPTIGGSPQGESSKLTLQEVVEVVSRYLK